MPRTIIAIYFSLLALAAACERTETPTEPTLDAQLRQDIGRWGVIPIGPMPTQPEALVDLGQALMFDKILSGNRDVACATCHHPSTHEGDGLSLSIGTGGTGLGPSRTLGPGRQFVRRNAPSLLNDGLGLFYLFWDGRVARFLSSFNGGPPVPGDVPNLLSAQAMLPVLDRREMRGEPGDRDVFGAPNELAQIADSDSAAVWQALMQRLLAIPEYVAKFNRAFPNTPTSALRFQQAAEALAAFQVAALTKTNSPFDRYLTHDDAALTTQQKRGAQLFFGTALCSSCHNGPLLGGNGFANAGVPQLGPGSPATPPLDRGRADLPDQQFYQFAFRVAPLRNVELTAPYMHDGAFSTLDAVVRHYNDVPLTLTTYDASQLDPALRSTYHGDAATTDSVIRTLDFRLQTPLHLSDAELADLVAFLKSLTDPSARDLSVLVPAAVPSGLPVPQ
ncbi:MAG TPA: cytochrome c peroxidase [Gemmatimonadales bacterium]|nr:cytochrome c peroxidase [Gemmatimonadales bacterium]